LLVRLALQRTAGKAHVQHVWKILCVIWICLTLKSRLVLHKESPQLPEIPKSGSSIRNLASQRRLKCSAQLNEFQMGWRSTKTQFGPSGGK
jgi:hypothetical protein